MTTLLPEKSQGQRNLEGYSPWGCKELNMTEVTTHVGRDSGREPMD